MQSSRRTSSLPPCQHLTTARRTATFLVLLLAMSFSLTASAQTGYSGCSRRKCVGIRTTPDISMDAARSFEKPLALWESPG